MSFDRAGDAVPVTVIGGYLGAGKTTLVNHLLRHGRRRIAVAVNEFGALPIDPDLIEGAEGEVLTLAGGCVCCAMGDDLVSGLADLVRRGNIDHILIEASGVALPGTIAQSLALARGLMHEATIVVADAETVRDLARDRYVGDTITRQLVAADIVLANKADLVAQRAMLELRAWLAMAAPSAQVVEARHGAAAPDLLLGLPAKSGLVCDDPAMHETAGLSSVSLEIQCGVDIERLGEMLSAPSLGLARAKGLLRDFNAVWKNLQVVGCRAEVTPAAPGARQSGRLICIAHGRKIERGAIERLVADCTTPPLSNQNVTRESSTA